MDKPESSGKQQSTNADDTMMAEVHLARAERTGSRSNSNGPGKACELAMQQYLDTSGDIFKVRSGDYRGYKVPESVRCATFQSNIAERAGLINRSEVTIRAIEFGDLMQSKGYKEERFKPGTNYPDGTYIVGEGSRDGSNSRHVAMICEGRLLHTGGGRVRNEAIDKKFFPGAYDSIRVYIPPRGHQRAEASTEGLQA